MKQYDAQGLLVDGVFINGSVGQWVATGDSANNATLTVTKAAAPGQEHYVTAIEVTISGAAAVNDIAITLQDGATTVWKTWIGSGAPRGDRVGVAFSFPLAMSVGNAANLVVQAGGTGVITTANMAGYTA